jgi:hypothetical protein
MLRRDESRLTTQSDSTCWTVSWPLVAIQHWDSMTSILLTAIRAARSRMAFLPIARATRALDATSVSAPRVNTTRATMTSMSE